MLEPLIPLAYLAPYLAILVWLVAMPSGMVPAVDDED
jgi:hypothetical protein